MGMWKSHRQRQAGKYAKASYKLELAEARRTAAMRRVQLAVLRVNVRSAIEASVPRRPDLP
jgi:hypothetical protein